MLMAPLYSYTCSNKTLSSPTLTKLPKQLWKKFQQFWSPLFLCEIKNLIAFQLNELNRFVALYSLHVRHWKRNNCWFWAFEIYFIGSIFGSPAIRARVTWKVPKKQVMRPFQQRKRSCSSSGLLRNITWVLVCLADIILQQNKKMESIYIGKEFLQDFFYFNTEVVMARMQGVGWNYLREDDQSS